MTVSIVPAAAPQAPSVPFAWAQEYLAGRAHVNAAADAAARSALAALLERQGFPASARALLEGGDGPTAASSADARLREILTKHGAPVVPSVNSTGDDLPRFFVTSASLTALAEAGEREFGAHGVDAELRLFLDEALAEGDWFVDAEPGLGFSALSAATNGQAITVHVLAPAEARDGRMAEEIATDLRASARLSEVHLHTHLGDSVDGITFDSLAPTAYVIVHAGDAAQVAPLMSRLRRWVQEGVVGAVAWRRTSEGADTAAAVLDVLGFAPFALVDGADGMELVPAHAVRTNEYMLSLSEAFIARAPRHATATTPTPERGPDGFTDGDYIAHHARALFDAIAEDLSPGSRELGRTPTRGELAMAQLEMAWPTVDVVSFDVFDTLVTRRVATPTDVFLPLGLRAPFADLGMAPEDFATARRQAERDARVRAAATIGSGEVTLPEIHAVLAETLGWDAARVTEMVEAERQLERDLCEAHPTLHAWFTRARNEGKTVWCLSDTYHDAAFLRDLLTHCGFDMSGVLVVASSEARCSKGEGRLFHQTLAAQNVQPQQILHIGDHDVADDEIPASLGLHTVLHPWPATRALDVPHTQAGDALAIGMAARTARCHEPAQSFWWRFGYSEAGPLLTGFALWLARCFRDDAIDRAYFLLRDGEILLDVYRAVVGDDANTTTALLESSRRAFALPAFDARRTSLLAQLTVSENPRPVHEFFARLGLSATSFTTEIVGAGFGSPDEIVLPGDRLTERRMVQLMRAPAIAAALHERAREERGLLLDYLDQEGVLAGGRVAFVDVGWNATIQRSLVSALDMEKRAQFVNGYYLGSLGPAHVGTGSGRAHGYLFEANEPADRTRTIMGLPQLLEFICSTTRGSLRRFAREDGRVVPVHGAVDHDDEQQAAHHSMRSGVMAFARDFATARRTFAVSAVGPAAAMQRLGRLIEHPTFEEAQSVGALTYGDGLGSDRSRHLAMFAADAWSVGAIHRDRKAAYWQKGLAGQYGPQALVLRTLQWLSQGGVE